MARITKTLQLVEGQDDDLIAWFARLPEGTGQRAFKDALRKGITGKGGDNHTPAPVAPPDDTLSALLKAVNDLPQALSLALIPALMQIASAPGIMPPPSANYIPAYELPEPAYKAKRSPKAEPRSEPTPLDNAIDTVDDLAAATGNFLNAFQNA